MMRQYELVERVRKYDPTADENLLNRAYVYAMMAHGTQKRASGDPFFSHPLEVAAILTEFKLDDATIVAALLHDVIEDTDVTRAEIDQKFGPEIGALVDGLTKIKKLDLVSKKAEQAENFRKLLVAISSDIRVLLIKLADRLHNMRTLEHMKPQSRLRVSEETLEIYAPLAGRMGMQSMRDELEELAFRWSNPEAYETVSAKLGEIRARNAGLVQEIEAALQKKLVEAGLIATVSGREKKPFSIWRKMQNRQISLEQLSDIYAFRIVTSTVSDCYRALGIAHSSWRAVPGRFKDYISTPKQNNYQSIHTTIVGPRHQWVELQIRTKEMHEIAEYGVAAHTLYKDGVMLDGTNTSSHAKENPYKWLRHLVDTLLEGDNSVEFLEHTKLELFQDQVFCFTPKGRLIALPRGATPIDFAYAVHTDVGNGCVGAIVNGRQMPLTTQLRNGDQVEIVLSKGQIPPAAWERIAVTGKARSSIRRAARDALRRQYSELGRRLLVAAFRRIGHDYADEKLKKSLSRLSQKSVEDVHAAVGRGELPVRDVLKAIVPESELSQESIAKRKRTMDRRQNEEGWFAIAKGMGLKFRMPASGNDAANAANGPALPIRGINNDVPVKFEEAGAVPGDRIVGVLSEGEGIRIFQIHSPKLKEYEHERWVDVTWDIDPEHPERFPAKIAVTALNEPGTLAQIAQVIGESDGNIDNVRMVRRAKDFTEMTIDLEVWDLDHLTQIISGLKGKGAVSSVERIFH
ncbi:MAG: bifunctional (p)ppGpp synthetase/guanosine-3',5'-bis(diphosphate) 3'-pyrophosphohydrolase [Hyphomicrobiales bacterium]|nr:MAG: bifunctional (p)ppGpp synthetase/guanosine-3',5'-bis(diphosphate) 3'-pyrophosphohydrolase [Hyphomicrobiales bacterium]